MRYEIRRASGDTITVNDIPADLVWEEVKGETAWDPRFFVEVPPGYALERICEATHHKLILNPFDKTLTIYDDYVE